MARENSRTAAAVAAMVKSAGKPMATVVQKIQDALGAIDEATARPDIARNYYNWALRNVDSFPELRAAEKEKGAFERSARGGRKAAETKAAPVKASVKSASAKKASPAKKSAPAKRKAGTKTTRSSAKKGRDVSALKAKLSKKAG